MLVLPTALLSLLSAPHPLLPTTARARPVALSVATWDELEAQLPSSLAPEPLIIDSALVHDRVNMHAIPRARRLAPASCEPRVPEAQGRLPRRASLEPLARACGIRGAPPPALPPAPPRLHRTPPCVAHHARACGWYMVASQHQARERPTLTDGGLVLYRERNGWCPYSERVW